ncbi:IS4 family transposase, partial [Catenulispora pinisilvae]|uniref:IS4 family transposase n=1 Tax=Catenulispora pinisilvae TaxID=2705253 RepID=UPI00189182A1
ARARARLGSGPLEYVFGQVAQPVAEIDTRGAWLGSRRLVSIDGMVWDLPDSAENEAVFGRTTGAAFAQARVVTLVESGSHCAIGARIGPAAGKGSGEQSAAMALVELLDADMLCLADRLFYGFELWCAAADTGAGLLWRIKDGIELPVVADLGDGSYTSLVFAKGTAAGIRVRLLAAARAGRDVSAGGQARLVRVVEYYVNGRTPAPAGRELICLITNLTDPADVPAVALAAAYHDRWEHEGANAQIKTGLRGPGRVLRSRSPDMVRQEIYGYLLAHYAITALICKAATETDTDPDRVSFVKAVRLARAHVSDPEAFSP